MNNFKKNVIIGIIFIIFLLIVFWLVKTNSKERYFNKVEIVNENYVGNRTDKRYLDTVVHTALQQMEIKGVYIILISLPDDMKVDFLNGIELKAFISGSGNQYMIFVGDMTRDESFEIISHEIVHLVQYRTKQLVVIDSTKNNVIWNGEKYVVSSIEYNNRPWEKEAFNKQGDIAKKVRSVLY